MNITVDIPTPMPRNKKAEKCCDTYTKYFIDEST